MFNIDLIKSKYSVLTVQNPSSKKPLVIKYFNGNDVTIRPLEVADIYTEDLVSLPLTKDIVYLAPNRYALLIHGGVEPGRFFDFRSGIYSNDIVIERLGTKWIRDTSGIYQPFASNVLARTDLLGAVIEPSGSGAMIKNTVFTNSAWLKDSGAVPTNIGKVGPISGQDTYRITVSSGNGRISQNNRPLIAGEVRRLTVLVKGHDDYKFAYFRTDMGTSFGDLRNYVFDLELGIEKFQGGPSSNITIKEVGNGYHLIAFDLTAGYTNSSVAFYFGVSNVEMTANSPFVAPSVAGIYDIAFLDHVKNGNDESLVISDETVTSRAEDIVPLPLGTGDKDLVLKFNDGSTSTFSNVSGNFTIDTSNTNGLRVLYADWGYLENGVDVLGLFPPYLPEDITSYPNIRNEIALQASTKTVLAHWHLFPRSTANAPYPDSYQSLWLDPQGEGGIWEDYGGRMRDRPIYRPPLPGNTNEWKTTDYKVDIERAKRMNIDGFQYNELDVTTPLVGLMLDAAESVGSFKVMLSFDCDTNDDKTDQEIIDYFNTYRSHPNVLRRNGDLIIGCYRPETLGTTRWATIIAGIGEDVIFAPTFLEPTAYETFASLTQAANLWAGNDYRSFLTGSLKSLRDKCLNDGKIFISSVWPQDHRTPVSAYWEARGSRTAITGWTFAIDNQPDYVIMQTWNDYSESHHWQPSWRTQYAYADLARYYAEWYKTGIQPAITREVLYYFHRIERTDAENTGLLQVAPRFENRLLEEGETYNEIELLAFLIAPGILEINGQQQSVGSGIQSFRIPWEEGTPTFKLLRNGKEVISFASNFENRTSSDYQDLMYRGGSSNRVPVVIP